MSLNIHILGFFITGLAYCCLLRPCTMSKTDDRSKSKIPYICFLTKDIGDFYFILYPRIID
jgi:hypothetical protein